MAPDDNIQDPGATPQPGQDDMLANNPGDPVASGTAGVESKEAFAFDGLNAAGEENKPANLDFILDIPLEISVELGRTRMMIHDLLKLGQGSVIELSKPAGDTLEILANNRLIAKGDVVSINDKYGIRLTEVISTVERLE